MAEIVNLRQARKRRSREENERQAAANRARFGRKAVEKWRARLESERAAREHAGKQIDHE